MKKIIKLFFAIIAIASLISVKGLKADSYSLNPGPYNVENLGSLIQSNTQEHQLMVKLSNGETHLLMHYVHPTGGAKTKILDVNLDQKTYRLLDEAVSRPGPAIYYPGDTIYFTTGDPQSRLIEYKPLTGDIREVGIMAEKTAGPGGAIGDDGALYFGSCCKGKATRYDPQTGTITDYGRMDEDSLNNYQYAYTIGADSRYVYVGLGQNPWYLSILDRQTNQKTVYWEEEKDTGGGVSRGVDGKLYYKRYNLGSLNSGGWYSKYYRLENGTPVEIAANQFPGQIGNYYGNISRDPTKFASEFGYEVDLSDAIPDNLTGGIATIRFRKVGAPTWDSVTATGFTLGPVNIHRLYSFGENKLLGVTNFYGPVFSYDISSNVTTSLGHPLYSLYDALFYDESNIYFSGYPAASLRYNPNNPWTLTSSTPNRADPSVNPYKIPASFGKYSYYSAKGSDGLVYIGAHHERDSTGGELGWYDPVTNKTLGSLRTPFLDYDVRDLKAVLSGTKLAYSSVGDKLFVFDVATKSIDREIQPLGPGVQLDKIVEVEPGVIFGIASGKMFKINIRTGEIIYVKDLPAGTYFEGVMSYNRRLILGPDGHVWILLSETGEKGNLYRTNPEDGSMQKVMTTGLTGSSLIFHGNDLYFYGATEPKRVKNMFSSLPEFSKADLNADSKIDLADFNILKSDFQKLTANLANPKSDINADGQVTIRDVGILMSGWKP